MRLLLGKTEIPNEFDVLAFRITSNTLAVAPELRIVSGQQQQPVTRADRERIDDRLFAVFPVDLPMRGNRSEIHDLGAGDGRLRLFHRLEIRHSRSQFLGRVDRFDIRAERPRTDDTGTRRQRLAVSEWQIPS